MSKLKCLFYTTKAEVVCYTPVINQNSIPSHLKAAPACLPFLMYSSPKDSFFLLLYLHYLSVIRTSIPLPRGLLMNTHLFCNTFCCQSLSYPCWFSPVCFFNGLMSCPKSLRTEPIFVPFFDSSAPWQSLRTEFNIALWSQIALITLNEIYIGTNQGLVFNYTYLWFSIYI